MWLNCADELSEQQLTSDELLDELFSIESESDRTRKLLKLEDRAKVLGIKAKFAKIVKAYEKDFKALEKIETKPVDSSPPNYKTAFVRNGEIIELDCGAWTADALGVRAKTHMGDVWACPHPIYPESVLVNIETGICKVKLWYMVRGRWREAIVDRRLIASNNSIVSLADYGVQVNTNNAKALVSYLTEVEALNPARIVERTSTSRLGWISGTFMPYGKTEIIFDNEASMMSLFNSIRQQGSSAAWYNMVRDLRKIHKLPVMVYIAASLASVLIEPCNTLPFIVDLWGGSGKGKTVSLMIAASIWADPSDGAYTTDAKSTSTAMEIRLNTLNSLPMLVDDMSQIENANGKDFTDLIYRWCSGKGRDRSNVNLGLNRLTNWRNCTLTNAEHSMVTDTMKGGAVNRIIDVYIGEKNLYDNGNEISTIVRENFGFLGSDFVQLVQNLGFAEIKRRQQEKYDALKDYSESIGQKKEDKQLQPMSLILVADDLLDEFVFKDGIRISLADASGLCKGQGEVNEQARAYDYLISSLTIHKDKFDDSYGECWGRKSPDNKSMIIIGTKFDQMLEEAGFQSKAFLAWAARNGKVVSDGGGKSRKTARFGGISQRCVYLVLPEEINEGFEQPPEEGKA